MTRLLTVFALTLASTATASFAGDSSICSHCSKDQVCAYNAISDQFYCKNVSRQSRINGGGMSLPGQSKLPYGSYPTK